MARKVGHGHTASKKVEPGYESSCLAPGSTLLITIQCLEMTHSRCLMRICQVVARVWRSQSSCTPQVGVGLVHPQQETVWQFLIKLNMHMSYDPTISLLVIFPREMSTYSYQKTNPRMSKHCSQ